MYLKLGRMFKYENKNLMYSLIWKMRVPCVILVLIVEKNALTKMAFVQ